MLPTTPEDNETIFDRLLQDIEYVTKFGRKLVREQLEGMSGDDFTITSYQDKNQLISPPVESMGWDLFHISTTPLSEEYWKQINEEILAFNKRHEGKITVNRGIPLANMGVAQIAQGKVIQGLYNIYSAYEDDRVCLQHLPEVTIDPEKEIAESVLYLQFERQLVSDLRMAIALKHKNVFHSSISQDDLSRFLSRFRADKKLLLYMILYRFVFALTLDRQLTTFVSRGEMLRAMSDLAVWLEDELKKNNPTLSGTLFNLLNSKVIENDSFDKRMLKS